MYEKKSANNMFNPAWLFGLYIVNRYFSYVIQKNILDMRVDNKPHIPGVFLSDDKKNITRDGKVLVSIDDDIIFNFFKNQKSVV